MVDTPHDIRFFKTESWDEQYRTQCGTSNGLSSWGNQLEFTRDSQLLAVSRVAYEISLFRPDTGRLVATLPSPSPNPWIELSPDGRQLAAGGEDLSIRIWHLDDLRYQLRARRLDW
jgi:WD40 repeat protein